MERALPRDRRSRALWIAGVGVAALGAAGLDRAGVSALDGGASLASVGPERPAPDAPGDRVRAAAIERARVLSPPDTTDAPVPADVRAAVAGARAGVRGGGGGPGHLGARRRGPTPAAGRGEAMLLLRTSDGGDAALTWEATDLGTLATVRGTVRLQGDTPRLAMAAAPRVAQTHEGRAHRCVALDDARGGFTAVCSVRAAAAQAASLSADDPRGGVWTTPGARRGETVVPAHLALEGAEIAAAAIGYRAGGRGVVVRLEATRVGAEPAALVLGADEKQQPEPPSFGWAGRLR